MLKVCSHNVFLHSTLFFSMKTLRSHLLLHLTKHNVLKMLVDVVQLLRLVSTHFFYIPLLSILLIWKQKCVVCDVLYRACGVEVKQLVDLSGERYGSEKWTYRISGNSFTKTPTSIWIEGVSSKTMMSARWTITLSNQEEVDSLTKGGNIFVLFFLHLSNFGVDKHLHF